MSYRIRIQDVLDICIKASAQIHSERKQLREDASKIPFYRVFKASHKNWEAALYKGKELSFCTKHIKAVGLSRGAYCFLSPEDAAMLYDLHRDYALNLKN